MRYEPRWPSDGESRVGAAQVEGLSWSRGVPFYAGGNEEQTVLMKRALPCL